MAVVRKGSAAQGRREDRAQEQEVARQVYEVTLRVEAIDGTIAASTLGQRVLGAVVRDEARKDFRGKEPRLRVSLQGIKSSTPFRSLHSATRDFRDVLATFVEQVNEIDRANAPCYFNVIVIDSKRTMIRCDFGERRVMWVPRNIIHPESEVWNRQDKEGRLAVLTWWAAMKGLIDG